MKTLITSGRDVCDDCNMITDIRNIRDNENYDSLVILCFDCCVKRYVELFTSKEVYED